MATSTKRSLSPHQAFVAAIVAEPESDDLRLIYSDFLEENGNSDWSSFIRIQLKLAEYESIPGHPAPGPERYGWMVAEHREQQLLRTITGDKRSCECEACLRQREQDLLDRVDKWFSLSGLDISPHTGTNRGPYFWPGSGQDWYPFSFRRGFVDSIEMPCQQWLVHGPALVREHPFCSTGVRLSDKEPGNFQRVESSRYYRWWKAVVPNNELSSLPPDLFDIVHEEKGNGKPLSWESRDKAMEALSRGCIKWAMG